MFFAIACDRPAEKQTPTAAPPSASSAPVVDPGPSLLTVEGFVPALAEIRARFTDPIQALDLRVYSDRIVLQAQDPNEPTHVDQYVYRNAKVSGPVPVKLQGKGKLEDNLFPLEDVKLDALPSIVARALDASPVEKAKVSHVRIKRNLPEEMDIIIRVHLTSARADAFVDADADGNMLEPQKK